MARSKIEWLGWPGTRPESWNPIKGCTRVSDGCEHCYALRESHMRSFHPNPKIAEQFAGLTEKKNGRIDWTGEINVCMRLLDVPKRWRKPRTCFVCSMSDLFHARVPEALIGEIFHTMISASDHRFLVLTKRPERMAAFLLTSPTWMKRPPKNVGLGISASTQKTLDDRLSVLLGIPAAMHFVSIEPMLGEISLSHHLWRRKDNWGNQHESGFKVMLDGRLDWVICGGESGAGARPTDPSWVRDLCLQCRDLVPFFFKQWGRYATAAQLPEDIFLEVARDTDAYPMIVREGAIHYDVGKKKSGHRLDGREWLQFPDMEV